MDDLELIRRCCQGQAQAWEEFLSTYCRLIYNYILSVLRSQGNMCVPDFVSDVYHDIIASLVKDNYRKLRSFKARNNASLATWLRHVTVNHCLTFLRRQRPPIRSFEEDKGMALSRIIAFRSPSAVEVASQNERLEQLTDCIQALDTEDRFFLELFIHRGLRLEELKDYYTVSRGAVDMRRSRIMKKLQDCFREHGYDVPDSPGR